MAKSKGRLLAELLASDGKVKESKSALDISGGKLAPADIPTLPNSKLENSSITIAGESTSLGGSVSLNTGHITEHTNYKYYTEGRVRAAISATGDISYNSTTGVISFSATDAPVISVNSSTGSVVLDTGDIAENGNLYHTTARARASISATGSLAYNSTTGVMSFTMPAQNTSNITEGTNKYYTDARVGSYLSTNGYATQSTIVGAITDSAPATLDTLNELAAALGDDANFSTTVTNSIATKLPLAGGTMTGAINMGSNNLTSVGTISSGAITAAGTFTGQNINLRNDVTGDGSTIRDISFLTSAAQGTDDRVALIRASNQAGDGSNRGGKLTFYTRQSGGAGFNSALILDNAGNATFSGTVTATGGNSTNWNTAYGWGNHASAGYYAASNPSGYTNDQTAAEILTAIKTVDGSGSGLDADSVDGVQASRIVYGDNATATNSISGAALNPSGHLKSGFYRVTSASSTIPNATSVNFVLHTSYNVEGNTAGFDLAANDSTTSKFYLRPATGGGRGAWQTIWTSSSDGAGSGLDADLLDGQHGSYYQNATNITSGTLNNARLTDIFKAGAEIPSSQNLNSYRTTGYYSQNSNNDASTGSNYPAALAGILEVITDDTGNGLHTLQRYARYNNNDTFNRYYYNGTWTSWRKEWNSLNDGSGSGLDADLLDGQQLSYVMNYDNLSNKPTNIGNSDTVDGIHAASFLRSDTADTATGTITFSGAVNLQGNVAFSKPIENFNTFTANKIHSSTETNMLAGKGSKLRVTIDGVASTSVASGLTNLNYEDRAVKGYQNDPDKVINIDLVTNGLYGSNGITYAAGFVVLNFYSSPFPSGYSSRVKNKDGTWTAMTLTKVGTTLRGTIPIGNYITDLEFTLSSGTTGPFVTGTEVWGLSDIAYYGNRMALSQGPNITSIGGYIDGNLTFGKTSGAPFTVNSSTVVTNLNADTVDGYHVGNSSNNTANRLVVTEGNGYISSNYFYTSSNNNGTTAISRIYASQDGYIRYYTPANFGAQISSHINYNSLQNKPSIPSLSGYATESYVGTQISNLVDSSPAALNTLNELAAAIGDDANFSTTVTNNIATKLPLAGGTLTGTLNVSATTNARDVKISAGYHLQRSDHHSGHLEGSYNNIGGNGAKSNPIYTIGSSYNPTDAALSNMYGIGYTSTSSSFANPQTGSYNWGMYVAADGDARVWLDGSTGSIWSTNQHYVGANVVWNAGNDGAGSGLDADLLDGQHGSYYAAASSIPTVNNGTLYITTSGSVSGGGSFTANNAGNVSLNLTGNGIMQGTNAVGNGTFSDAIGAGFRFQRVTGGSNRAYGSHHNLLQIPNTSGDQYLAQMAFGTGDTKLAWRSKGTSFGSWFDIWHSGNDGSGSGLDADLLDGQHGSYYYSSANPPPTYSKYLRSDTDDSFTGNNLLFPTLSLNIANNNGAGSGNTYFRGDSTHFVFGLTSGNTLYMNYGNSAGAFRTEGTITHNSLLVGTKPWGNSNDGSGSGLDADLLDGQQGSYYAPASHVHSYLPLAGGTLTGGLGGTTASFSSNLTALNHIVTAGDGNKIGFWGGTGSYAIWMASSGSGGRQAYEPNSDYNMYFRMGGGTNRGFVFQTGSSSKVGIDSLGNIRADGVISSNNRQAMNCVHWSASGTSTGAVKITLPGSAGSVHSMPIIKIYTYQYSSTAHVVYTISGHDWSTGSNWYNNRVTAEGGPPLAVRLGHDGTNYCIIIGETNTSWSYGSATVELKAHPSYYAANQNFTTGWGATQITTMPSTVTTQTVGKIWDSSNDGSGSGLDADLLDGQHASAFLTAETLSSTNSVTVTGTKYWQPSGSATSPLGGGGGASLQASTTGTTAAYMAFHRHAAYAINWGLDTSNAMVLGGWSSSTTVPRMSIGTNGLMVTAGQGNLWGASNDGSGSGLDADLLDGQHGSHYLAWANVTGKPTIPTNNNQLTNGAGYLTNSNDRIFITDTRSADRAPSYYDDRYVQADFSQSTYFGVSGGDSWGTALTISKWASWNASHRQEQLIFAGTKLARRVATSDSAWSATYTIWDSSTDGSGSGLDADLLDGQQGSYYAPASHVHSYLPLAGGTITGNLNVNGTTTLGNGNADQTHINDTLYLGATDSGDSHFYFGENSSNWYGDHWYWDSGYEVERYSRYAGTDTLIEKHDTRYTHKVQTNRAYERLAHSTGYQIGSYNSVGANSTKTNPIYTIGDNYRPSDTSVAGMYGIGYAHSNLWGTGSGKSTGWGQYVVEGGTFTQTFSLGGTWSLGEFNRNGNKVWDAGNDGSGSGLDADTVDGIQGASLLRSDTSDSIAAGTTYTFGTSNSEGFRFTNSSYNKSLYIGGWSGSNSSGISRIRNSNDNLHIDCGSAGSLYFNHYATGNIYYRGSTLWGAINDGSGSGLDADLLDGRHLQQIARYQSGSDFANGTLVTTDIVSSGTNGDSFVIEITGKAYGSSKPHSVIAEGYLYNNSVIATSGTNISGNNNFTYLKVMSNGGYLSFWWPRHAYWNSYDVHVRSSSGGTANYNRVTAIANSVDPSGATKKITINLAKTWNSDNDGSGSGVDADLLDGQHASAFQAAGSYLTAETVSTTNSPVITGQKYFQSNRNTTSNSPPLQAYSTSNQGAIMSFHKAGHYGLNMGLDSDTVFRIGGWSASANLLQMDMSGNLTMAGNVTAYSDIRLKENIKVIPNALSKVQQLRGVTFTRNDIEDLEKLHTGVIAQEVEVVLPEAVSEDNDGIKNVAYGNMVGLLIEAIKELKDEVNELKQQIKEK